MNKLNYMKLQHHYVLLPSSYATRIIIKTQTVHAMSGVVVHFFPGIPGAVHDLTCIAGSSKYWAGDREETYKKYFAICAALTNFHCALQPKSFSPILTKN
eukprot:TRINITY_DN7098_c0_g1_i9.p1 TRINITY_DN7098_c0_g1~~TRINITY_DN7098_c0_g1_i9.p1  ORF type:complete len:100 (+),score=6.30 TRINITY_DN7098_c0_g1_i9:77-376(+)